MTEESLKKAYAQLGKALAKAIVGLEDSAVMAAFLGYAARFHRARGTFDKAHFLLVAEAMYDSDFAKSVPVRGTPS